MIDSQQWQSDATSWFEKWFIKQCRQESVVAMDPDSEEWVTQLGREKL